MGQTRTEKKLAKALEALKYIRDTGGHIGYADKVYAELTAPRTETVEIRIWKWHHESPRPTSCPEFTSLPPVEREKHLWIELTNTYHRPAKEESWDGVVIYNDHDGDAFLNSLPYEWVGRRVVVEVVEEGE